MAAKPDIKALFEAGVHFGHKTSRWHPKMAPYIHSKRGDSHIIDLTKTVAALDEVLPLVTKTVAEGKKVLFVATKKQSRDVVRTAAESVDQPYVTQRWVGGMLTNVTTMTSQLKKLRDMERRMASGDYEKRYSKLEVQQLQEEIDAMNEKYGGIKNLSGKPGLVVVFDVLNDVNAVREARTIGSPVVGVVDTNANPEAVDYAIPGNDDAVKGTQLLADYVAQAVQAGATKVEKPGKKES